MAAMATTAPMAGPVPPNRPDPSKRSAPSRPTQLTRISDSSMPNSRSALTPKRLEMSQRNRNTMALKSITPRVVQKLPAKLPPRPNSGTMRSPQQRRMTGARYKADKGSRLENHHTHANSTRPPTKVVAVEWEPTSRG